MGWAMWALLTIGGFLIAVSLVRKRWRFRDTPTSDAAHVFPGLTEVHGVVEAPWTTTASPVDGKPCVWWNYTVERRVQRDKRADWVTEESGRTVHPFVVRDASGAVTVMMMRTTAVVGRTSNSVKHLSLSQLRPSAQELVNTYEQSSVGRFFGKDNSLDEPIDDFGGTWRADEKRLCVGEHVFITTKAQLTPDGAAVVLSPQTAEKKNNLFEISVGDEAAAMSQMASAWVIGVAAVLSFVGSVVLGVQWADRTGSSTVGKLMITTLPIVIAAVVLLAIGVYNRVRRVRERVDFAWSLIDVAHTQRATVIPQLQSVVIAAMDHERQLLTAAAAARSVGRTPTADGIANVNAVSAAAEQIVVRSEAYPDPKTATNVSRLMQQLTLLNDRVAFGRRFYNDSVEQLANRCGVLPDSLVAKALRITVPPYFELTEPPDGPRVNFAPPTL
jgi:LemA protein